MRKYFYVIIAAIMCLGFHSCSDSTSAPVDENIVETAPTITTEPQNMAVSVGDAVEFIAEAEGTPAPSIQWQMKSQADFENIDGETSTTLRFESAPEAWNGYQFRAEFTNSQGTTYSPVATLSVQPVASFVTITKQPEDQTACEGNTVLFEVEYSIPTPSAVLDFQWQFNSGFGWQNLPTSSNNVLKIAAFDSEDGNQYRLTITHASGSVTSDPATLNVLEAPVVTLHPTDLTASINSVMTFAAQATGSTPLSVQWQMSMDGGITYSDLTGAIQDNIVINGDPALNGALLRAAFSSSCGTIFTNPAVITII